VNEQQQEVFTPLAKRHESRTPRTLLYAQQWCKQFNAVNPIERAFEEHDIKLP